MRSRRSATVSAPNDRRPEPSHSSSSNRRMAMEQSSSSIGALATALAKAQIELVNPEKSMIATIRSDDKGSRCLPDHGWMREPRNRHAFRYKWDWVLGADPHCESTATTRTHS